VAVSSQPPFLVFADTAMRYSRCRRPGCAPAPYSYFAVMAQFVLLYQPPPRLALAPIALFRNTGNDDDGGGEWKIVGDGEVDASFVPFRRQIL
jgi:hypothetical protein